MGWLPPNAKYGKMDFFLKYNNNFILIFNKIIYRLSGNIRINRFLFKTGLKKRYTFHHKKKAFNSYFKNVSNKEVKDSLLNKISAVDARILLKFCAFTKIKKLKIADWGGGVGNNLIFLSKIKYKFADLYEKKKIVSIVNNNKFLKKKFEDLKINFKNSHNVFNFKEYDLILFFGSFTYLDNAYNILNNNMLPKYIGISRLPLIINSNDEPLMVDEHKGTHIEKLFSKRKFLYEIKKNYKILYIKECVKRFNKTWNGSLPKSKSKIFNYKLKSYNIFLKKII